MAVAGSAVAAGLALTLSVPFVALHELLVKRHKAQMNRHFPAIKKRVNFCSSEDTPVTVAAWVKAETEVEAPRSSPVEVSPLPAYKSIIRRSPPPPSYDEVTSEGPRPLRPSVRFAERA